MIQNYLLVSSILCSRQCMQFLGVSFNNKINMFVESLSLSGVHADACKYSRLADRKLTVACLSTLNPSNKL